MCGHVAMLFLFFFFKQKTAYEIAHPWSVVAGRQGTPDVEAYGDALERAGEIRDDGRGPQSHVHDLSVARPTAGKSPSRVDNGTTDRKLSARGARVLACPTRRPPLHPLPR